MPKNATTCGKRYIQTSTDMFGNSVKITLIGSWTFLDGLINYADASNIVELAPDCISSWEYSRDFGDFPFGFCADTLTLTFNVERTNNDLLDILREPFYYITANSTGEVTGDTYNHDLYIPPICILEIGAVEHYFALNYTVEEEFSDGCTTIKYEFESIVKSILSNMDNGYINQSWDFNTYTASTKSSDRAYDLLAKRTGLADQIISDWGLYAYFWYLNIQELCDYLNYVVTFYFFYYYTRGKSLTLTVFDSAYILPNKNYKQSYLDDGLRGSLLNNDDLYVIGWITNKLIANASDSDLSIYSGGWCSVVLSNYKTCYDFFINTSESNLNRTYSIFNTDYGIKTNYINAIADGTANLDLQKFTGQVKTKYEVITSVESIPIEQIDKSINKFLTSDKFLNSDNKISVENSFTNTPLIANEYETIWSDFYGTIEQLIQYKINPLTIYYIDSPVLNDNSFSNVAIRIHEASQYMVTNTIDTDTMLGVYTPITNIYPISNDASWIAKYQGLEYNSGVYNLTARAYKYLFDNLKQAQIELKGNQVSYFELLNFNRYYTIDLEDFNKTSKTLFTGYPTKFLVKKIVVRDDNSCDLTLFSQRY